MQDWKIKQEIYHRLNQEHSDDLSDKDVIINDDIVNNAVRYFKETNIGWIYPAKSYMVGICYARWLSEEYGGEPLEYLKDDSLLYGNDPYFVSYKYDCLSYDNILKSINGWSFDETLGIVPDVRKYYEMEFMVNV